MDSASVSEVAAIRKIRTVEELDGVLETSSIRPVWLFKHSLACPLSAEGLREFEKYVAAVGDRATFALIEVQTSREVSTETAERLAVRHETPQAILIVDGAVVWQASHWEIYCAALERALPRSKASTDSVAG